MQSNGLRSSRRALVGALGFGASALPFLPLFETRARAASTYPRRLVLFLGPLNGLQAGWVPAATGAKYDLPERLAPLAPYKSDLILLSGLAGPALDGFKDAHKLGMGGLFTGSRALARRGRQPCRRRVHPRWRGRRSICGPTTVSRRSTASNATPMVGGVRDRRPAGALEIAAHPP